MPRPLTRSSGAADQRRLRCFTTHTDRRTKGTPVRPLFVIWVASATLAASMVTAAPTQARPPAGAAEVRAWNETAMTTLVAAAVPVPEQPLYLAYVHRAVFDAARRASGRHGVSIAAAVTSAAYTILATHFADQRPALQAERGAALSTITAGDARRAGVVVGRRAAHRLLAERADDGRNGTPLAAPVAEPGVWTPEPPNQVGVSSWLGSVRPFALRSASAARPPVPPALTSATWARDFEEVRRLGGAASTERTPAQTEVARFWSDPPYVQNQSGLRDYSLRHELGALATARLFALADTAAADALIACFDAKYHYVLWRPVRAIPAGDTDGNPSTQRDATWTPLLVTPNHPEYPSAHSCATTALSSVVAALGNGRLDLRLTSTVTGTTRHYTSVPQLTAEVADARVWGGLHWRFSTAAGEQVGRAAARAVLAECQRQRRH
jgi:PAP2 superfamily